MSNTSCTIFDEFSCQIIQSNGFTSTQGNQNFVDMVDIELFQIESILCDSISNRKTQRDLDFVIISFDSFGLILKLIMKCAKILNVCV